MYNPTKTAENIKILCIKKGITVKRLSEISGVGRDLASEVKNGKTTSIYHFCKIADALGVTLDELVDNSRSVEI